MKWLLILGGIMSMVAIGFYWYSNDVEAMVAFSIIAILAFIFAGFMRLEEIIKEQKHDN